MNEYEITIRPIKVKASNEIEAIDYLSELLFCGYHVGVMSIREIKPKGKRK